MLQEKNCASYSKVKSKVEHCCTSSTKILVLAFAHTLYIIACTKSTKEQLS
jgi:hypothetical protein